MASKNNSACVQCTKVLRFSEKGAFRTWYMDISQDGCRLALSGWNDNTKDTFIDLFALNDDPGFRDLSLTITSKPYFSTEFTKIECSTSLSWRCACILDDSVFVTCCGNTIESYDTKHDRLINQSQLTGEASCMAITRDGRVYVGLWRSNDVIVFDQMLNQINKIKLKGLEEEGCPWDMTVKNNNLFIITAGFHWRALMCNINGGDIEYEFKKPNLQYKDALSITVSEENELIYILWWEEGGKRVVVVYSLPWDRSSLPGGHSLDPGCHFLASFTVSDVSWKARVNNYVNRLFVVTEETGEVYKYDTNDIINRKNLLTLIELLITKDDRQKLLNYFKVPAEEANTIQENDEPSKSVLQHLRKTGKISAVDISLLLTACNNQGINQVTEAWTNYQKYISHQKVPLLQLKQHEDQRQQLTETLSASESGRQRLNDRLKRTQLKKNELAKRLTVAAEETQQVSQKLKESEEKRVQLGHKLQQADDERRDLKDKFHRSEEDRKELTERLKIMHEKYQQVIATLNTTEKEQKQISDGLMEANYENQQLTGRLEMAEKEEKQMKEILEEKKRQEQQLTNKLEMTEKEKKELISRLEESDDERQQLTGRLKTTEGEMRQLAEKIEAKELEETKCNLRAATDELVKAQVKYAKESMVQQEVLQQIRKALNKQAVTSTDSIEQVGTLPKENETSDVCQELIALAADFGRLMVDVAEDLTLDNTLKLAFLFELPDSEKDMLRRISLIETPGITLVNFLKTRNVINMYDVTNLQKGLMRLHLHRTNTNYVIPYQLKIDQFQFEENRSPDLADWPDEEAESPKASKSSDSQESERAEESNEPQNEDGEDNLTERLGTEENPRQRQDTQNMQIREPYIEHKVNDEGGTIALMGVYFAIPEEALTGDHVIAVTVIRNPDAFLPGINHKGRMTPLIKLEPEGLKLKTSARLIIPHSAIMPEPDRHSVIIFTGQSAEGESQKGTQKGHITWTEEKSVEGKLDQETICLAINTLSYVFVNLASHEMEQKHLFRVVPFIDGILDTKDDVLITVCFCKDSDAEFQLLLNDHKSKLYQRSYMTFQVYRLLSEYYGGGFDLGLTMCPQRDNYCLSEGKTTKLVDIDHLCAASRISVQFRLKRSKERDDEMIDVKLEVSQGEKNKIALILQSKVKNILLSKETQNLLSQELTTELGRYENLKQTVSKLLEKKHCEKVATAFELKPAEMSAVLNDPKPGAELVKILAERELIMPNKMFGLYQALKASHLDKIGRHVLEYIAATKTENINDSTKVHLSNTETSQVYKREGLRDKESKLTRNARILTNEGFKRLDVHRALKLSHGKLDLGRRLLLLANDEHESLSLLPGSNVHKEQYIDELGGEMTIAGIHLRVPPGALNTGRIVSLSISTQAGINGPISNSSLRLTPLLNFGPANLLLRKPVTMIIPHCAFITSNQTGLNVYSGISHKDKEIKWNLERNYSNCTMKNNNLQVEIHKPCGLIGPHIPFQRKMMKHIGVIPIMKRPCSPTDELTISLWFYNDGNLEHESLVHDEVYNGKGIVLHDPVTFQVRTMGSTLPVSISSQWNVNPKKVEVDVNSLWLLDRHKVTFYLHTEGNTDWFNFEIESRYGFTRRILFQLTIRLKGDDLYRFDQTTSPFQQVLPKFTMESFKELLKEISKELDAVQSSQLANIFQLPEDVIYSIERHRKPGNLLMEMLSEKFMVSASNVSRLEYALTEIGNDQCAKLVRDFRRIQPVVHATMSPGDGHL